jgi:hypothetical protein
MYRHFTRTLAVAALAALAACSGAGGSLSPAPVTGGATSAPAGNGSATLTFRRLALGGATFENASKRRTRELSAAANSLVVDATQTGAAPYHAVFDISGAVIGNGIQCNSDVSGIYQVCSLQARLPIGNDILTIATNTARDGSGTTLGSATTSVTIKDQQDNAISFTLDGNVASLKLFAADPVPRAGTPENIALIVQLYDSTGTLLIAPQNYTQPVVLTDNDPSGNSSLYTQATQNSTQRYNNTPPVNASPSPTAKTVSVPDRYTVAYVSYNGAAVAAFTVTAAFGTFTASTTITPSSGTQNRNAGTTSGTHFLANTVRSYDPVYDNSGTLWVTQTGGKIASIDTSTYTVTGTYTVSTSSVTRSLRAPVLAADGAIYMDSATVSGGVATAPYYVTRFDPVNKTFTDYPAADQVLHLTIGNGYLAGAERNVGKVWSLPLNGPAPGTPSEFAVSTPPVIDSSPVLLPLPTRVFPTGDGNWWVVETPYSAVDGTWLAKYSPSGTKISETQIAPAHMLDAQATDATGAIWFVDLANLNEFIKLLPSSPGTTAQTFGVPRLYGFNSWNEFQRYLLTDASGNLLFVSYLDGRIGRVDNSFQRVDMLNPYFPGSIYSLSLTPDGKTLVGAGFVNGTGTGTGPYLFTLNVN